VTLNRSLVLTEEEAKANTTIATLTARVPELEGSSRGYHQEALSVLTEEEAKANTMIATLTARVQELEGPSREYHQEALSVLTKEEAKANTSAALIACVQKPEGSLTESQQDAMIISELETKQEQTARPCNTNKTKGNVRFKTSIWRLKTWRMSSKSSLPNAKRKQIPLPPSCNWSPKMHI
jgi:hypothetical protein